MTLRTYKVAIRTNDLKLMAEGHRILLKEGMTERQIYRLALAADAELSYEEWAERTQLALLRYPGATAQKSG